MEKQVTAVDKTGTSCSRFGWYLSSQYLVREIVLHSWLDCEWAMYSAAKWWQCGWTVVSPWSCVN